MNKVHIASYDTGLTRCSCILKDCIDQKGRGGRIAGRRIEIEQQKGRASGQYTLRAMPRPSGSKPSGSRTGRTGHLDKHAVP